MRILAVSEYWFPPVAQGLHAPSAILSELARQGHAVHLLSAKAMLEDSDMPSGLTLELWPDLYAGHDREIRGFIGWTKTKLAEWSGQSDAVVSFCPWVAATTMVLGYPLAAQANRDDGPTRGARDRLMKWMLGTWHPRYRFLGHLEAQAVSDAKVRQRLVLDDLAPQAWQRVLKLPDTGWRCLPMASTGPRLTRDERLAARQRVRQAFAIDDDSLALAAWVNQPTSHETSPLLRAFSSIMSSGSRQKTILLLAGELGYAQQKQAADLGIRDRIRFVGWTARTSDFWAAADVAIQLWPCQGRSGPTIEALGLGVPVIVPDNDPILERLFKSADANGYFTAGQHQMTAASIAKAIGWMMDETHRRKAIEYAKLAADRLAIQQQASELILLISRSKE